MITDQKARELLGRVGESLDLGESVKDDMKAFILSKVYGESMHATCGEARASKWRKMKKKSTLRLPPDDDSLNLLLERTNYISYCQLHYSLFDHPSPIGHGWELINGKCRPVCYTKPPLSQQTPFVDSSDEDSDNDLEDSDSESNSSTDSE